MRLRLLALGFVAMTCAACISADDQDDASSENAPLSYEPARSVTLPSGTLGASVVEIASEADLLETLEAKGTVYIHSKESGAWYFETGHYLLGVDAFTQFHQDTDKWITFGSGTSVAPSRTRIVARNVDGAGWSAASVIGGSWPETINGVWVIGTNDGVLTMGDAPELIPVGTVVVGSMQAYGGNLSTPWLYADQSTHADSARIRGMIHIDATTQLGGHSAGSSTARRIALDVGVEHVYLYGTPNYSRGDGARTLVSGSVTEEILNNPSDPVTNCLAEPWSLVSLAWGTAKCHDYAHWDYTKTAPREAICN